MPRGHIATWPYLYSPFLSGPGTAQEQKPANRLSREDPFGTSMIVLIGIDIGGVRFAVTQGCNAIGEQGAKYIAGAIEKNPIVEGYWLKRNQIGLTGLQAILSALRTNQT